ncbi:MAG: NAD(P)H-dependent oxidoreductase [Chloroflexi bacterium]|nr:NAD(P)H-dependent oxidoreductase [Chloroflexota bacterium]
MTTILVLYDSHGAVKDLAEAIAEGVGSVPGATALSRSVDAATRDDLVNADGLVLGSPNWSGVTGRMKQWLDSIGDVWQEGQMTGKPGAAFTAGSSRSAGIEATLLQLIHWMLAGGMVIVGLPWDERMKRTGSYYGATVCGTVTLEDRELARTLGKRLAETALRLRR